LVLAAIVFAETGLFDRVLPPRGFAAIHGGFWSRTQGFFNLGYLVLLLSVMAVVGDALGYFIGHKAGEALYVREESFWFRRKHLLYAKEFYEKHGGKAIFLARFVPFARTFAPVVAGVAQMSYARFASYNIFGGIFWVCSNGCRVLPGLDSLASISKGSFAVFSFPSTNRDKVKAEESKTVNIESLTIASLVQSSITQCFNGSIPSCSSILTPIWTLQTLTRTGLLSLNVPRLLGLPGCSQLVPAPGPAPWIAQSS
jgi:hypothetical protein